MAKTALKQFRNRSYLAKDFDSLRANLLQYARLYYPDKIQDFSESSLGGMFLDMAAYTGDVMSFYLDHQYNELDSDTAIETSNIERLIRSAGVPISGAAPATVDVTFFIEVPAAAVDGKYAPLSSSLPVVKANSIFTSTSGINFSLLADVDFASKTSDGSYVAEIKVGKISQSGNPVTFTMAIDGKCISGYETSETFGLGSFVAFKSITLSQNNITDILSVSDSLGNSYYEVSTLSDDVVYKNVLNTAHDSNDISEALKVVPAPYRFVTVVDLTSRSTTMILGGGDDNNIDDDAVPDPSEFAISFPYSKTFSRTSINPLKMLNTRTLGVYSPNTQLSVTYRYGGGLNHNVPARSITNINQVSLEFPLNPRLEIINLVRGSMGVINKSQAAGGEDAPTIDELKSLIPSSRNAQERIVTKEDLLARIYSLPANFGRVFRAAVRANKNNPLSTQLHIICRTPDSRLIPAPDTLKENIRKYLNPYRLITDAIDILDASVVNLSFQFDIVIDPALNQQTVLQTILSKLIEQFNTTKFSIDQPIVLSDIQNLIFNTPGVLSIINIEFKNLNGETSGRAYSNFNYDVKSNLRKGMLYPPEGGIFEFKYPEFDIIGRTAL
jgi:hypothetical protein